MISLSSVKQVVKLLRDEIIIQSELDSSRIGNGLSLYGDNLEKHLNSQQVESYEGSDCFIVFELKTRESSSDFSKTEKNQLTEMFYYRSYRMFLVMYGNDSPDISNNLTVRFRSEDVRDKLQNQGIYLEKVSDPYSTNDFKNGVMWMRNDIFIDITCKFTIKPVYDDSHFEDLSDLKIIKKEIN